MKIRKLTPTQHAIADYIFIAGLFAAPRVLGLSKEVSKLYTAEAAALLGYAALSEHPLAIKPLIPYNIHGKIDPMNGAAFAVQTFVKPVVKDRKAMIFNAAFSLLTILLVVATDWKAKQQG